MDIGQLQVGLEKAFFRENHRIVFWYDAEQSFVDDVQSLNLKDVKIIDMSKESSLGIKLLLEIDDKVGQYLLYFPSKEPDIEDDWLLDIKLYSRTFYADRFSIIFNELGLKQLSLKDHLIKRQKFLANKSRVAALKRYASTDMNEVEIDLAMIASIVKAEQAELIDILFALADGFVEEDLGLSSNPSSFAELEKYDLLPTFLDCLKSQFGYVSNTDQEFRLGRCFISLLMTDCCGDLGTVPTWAQSLIVSSSNYHATIKVFLSRWRDSSKYYGSLDHISELVAKELKIADRIASINIQDIQNVMTFSQVDRHIMIDLVSLIPKASIKELEHFQSYIRVRLDGYWASVDKNKGIRAQYQTIYAALKAAIELFILRHTFRDGFHFSSCEALYKAYEKDIYQIDTAYRHYCIASKAVQVELLKELDAGVEECYSHWYIDHLAKNWGDNLESEQRLQTWRIPGISNQYKFYASKVAPLLDSSGRRVVVIISDALRYEAAVELCERINHKRYSEATLSSQLGVVPSYTTLGMASLLPHRTLEYKNNTDDVLLDGLSTQGTDARSRILSSYGGFAVTAETVKNWSREEGREALRDKNLVYVYHNVIDARGDSASTESETFAAVEDAINELNDLSRKIMMHLNTSTVLITADHGFLFQQGKLSDADKSSLVDKPSDTIKSKKRYLIGANLPNTQEAWKGSIKDTAHASSDTEFWIPKGANRFHFVGGSRFVHGGAMPQEIVVPIITIKHMRGENAQKRTASKVDVISLKSTWKMVNNIQRFDLMQTESIGEFLLPVTVAVAIYDEDTKVSSEEIVTFDSSADADADRKKQVRLSLLGNDFDRKKEYFLLLKDKELDTEIGRYKVTIDLAFTDDFF